MPFHQADNQLFHLFFLISRLVSRVFPENNNINFDNNLTVMLFTFVGHSFTVKSYTCFLARYSWYPLGPKACKQLKIRILLQYYVWLGHNANFKIDRPTMGKKGVVKRPNSVSKICRFS